MVREDQSIGNHHIFSSASGEDYYFGNVIGRKGFASTIAKSQYSERKGVAGKTENYAYTASAFDLSP